MTKYVYDFSEGNKDMKDLLGGKGANLAEMTNMGLPVPPGFTITTEACLTFLANDGAPPEMLQEAGEHLAYLQETMGRQPRRPGRSAAGLRALRREVLDAGDDGHGPEPRAERRVREGPREADRRRHAVRVRRLPPVHPDVRQDRHGRAGDAFEHALDEAKERKGPGTQDTDLDADDLRRADRAVPGRSTGSTRARSSRRTPRSSCGWRSRRCSGPGTASGRSTTGARTRSPTTSARP